MRLKNAWAANKYRPLYVKKETNMSTAKQTKRIVKGYASARPRVQIKFTEPTRTKQSFIAECDINNIMAKFQKTGAITHLQNNQAQYGFASSHDFRESMEIVEKAERMFAELPSSIRAKFNQSPGEFLDFVQNPENADELVDLGLANAPAPLPLGSAENPLSVLSDPAPNPPPAE